MRHVKFGGLDLTRLGLGTMTMSGGYDPHAVRDDTDAVRVIRQALDLGVTHIAPAEVYGPFHNEELVGKALQGRRDEAILTTRFGQYSHARQLAMFQDSSPTNMRIALDGSLRRLQTDHIDVYIQHRVDPHTPIEDVVGLLSEFVQQGKVRFIGLSEAGPDTVRRAHDVHPVTLLHSELSLWTRDVASSMLPVTRELGIGYLAYAPLGRGFFTGMVSPDSLSEGDYRKTTPRFLPDNYALNQRLLSVVADVAAELNASTTQVALAWVLAQGEDIAAIPSTRTSAHLTEALVADGLTLTTEQLQRLDDLPAAAGARYKPDGLARVGI